LIFQKEKSQGKNPTEFSSFFRIFFYFQNFRHFSKSSSD